MRVCAAFNSAICAFSALSFSCTHAVFADSVPNIYFDGKVFLSGKLRAKATLTNHGSRYLVSSPNSQYETALTFPFLERGTAVLSDDGRSLVWILNDPFLGNLRESDEEHCRDSLAAPALLFFLDGALIGSYSLGELLCRNNLIGTSVCHTSWLDPSNKFSLINDKFFLNTKSFRHYEFDISTGMMIVEQDSPVWKKCDALLRAELISAGENKFFVNQATFVKGDSDFQKSTVVFDPTKTFSSGWHLIGVKKKGNRWVIVEPESNYPLYCYELNYGTTNPVLDPLSGRTNSR